jgi:hypothetical protein
MSFNKARVKRFATKSVGDLTAIAESGSLARTAACHELKSRGVNPPLSKQGWKP